MARTFFRIVWADPPSPEDFVSNAAKGKIPARSLPRNARGLRGFVVKTEPVEDEGSERVGEERPG